MPASEESQIKSTTCGLYRLKFGGLALVGAVRMLAEGEDEREEARLIYVGAMRAT